MLVFVLHRLSLLNLTILYQLDGYLVSMESRWIRRLAKELHRKKDTKVAELDTPELR